MVKQAILPIRASDEAVGFDLASCTDFWLQSTEISLVYIGWKFQFPEGYYGRIVGRSGLAIDSRIYILEGTIDSDFRGEVGVIVWNLSAQPFKITRGMRIAQLIISPYITPVMEEVKCLTFTDRGESGFGSSGY